MDLFPRSSLDNRKNFYKQEFSVDALDYFFFIHPQFFVIDHGTETRIINDPKKANSLQILQPNLSFKALKAKLIIETPEDVYYDRNLYKDPNICLSCRKFDSCFTCPYGNFMGQQLVFDIDPQNINCSSCGLSKHTNFCPECIQLAVSNAFLLKEELLYRFSDVRVVFSGRGAHVHVMDSSARRLSFSDRVLLNKQFAHLGIDQFVSAGSRLIRLPYSLNALSSRRVVPIQDSFDIFSEVLIPSFLKSSPI